MKQQDFFRDARWVEASNADTIGFSVLRGSFCVKNAKKVTMNILGMGFFKCYINGHCINPDTFLPLSSEYDCYSESVGESLTGHRVYVPQFDITDFVQTGENVIAVHFGGGWYLYQDYPERAPKAIYCIAAEGESETDYFISDESCRVGKSFVTDYAFTNTETHDYLNFADCFGNSFDDSGWEHAVLAKPLETEYCLSDCPTDRVIETISVRTVGKGEHGTVYDCGRNTSGYPVLEIKAKPGETVTVAFSEELLPDGRIHPVYRHKQTFQVRADGQERTVQPEFMWFAFRYFEVSGHATVKVVKEIHADVPVASSFECDNETLNWIHETFAHTMLTNMHGGHPSDCPHAERRGYTGDGQLTCHAALSVLGAETFYEKWLQDIADGQDLKSGHIQYTAPYIASGGGPGGWGSAIVEVPYQLYRHFGNPSILEKYYKNMRRYIDYLEEHSEFGLVTSDKEGAWCLGDWCAPNILSYDKNVTYRNQQVFLPPSFVNTYFMVKSLEKMCKIADVLGKHNDIDEYRKKIKERKAAIRAAYLNSMDGNFIMGVQGANALAVDLGLGDERTYSNLVSYYQKTGCLDTGIFATDIVIRTLFEHGDGELAVDLLTQEEPRGFGHWRKNGATTFHEYWGDCVDCRSHNHHMFGAVAAYLLEYLLGIKQEESSAGYASLVIEPTAISRFSKMAGSMETPLGTVSVAYRREERETVQFHITIPEGTKAVFCAFGQEVPLTTGENLFTTEDFRK